MVVTTLGVVQKRFRPYPKYKDSRVAWLGGIPEQWSVLPIKRVCQLCYGETLRAGDRADGEIAVFGSNGPVGTHDIANTEAPCIVVGRKGSFGKVNYSADAVFAIDTTFFTDARYTRVDVRWLYYVLLCAELDANSKDSAIPGLDREDAYARTVAVAPIPQQRVIAAFLDRETAKIDALVARKERLIKLLQEKRMALIARAVTRGLDLNGPMKDSGVESLGEIPANWDTARLWRLCSTSSGATPSKENPAYWSGEISWISAKDMKRRVIEGSIDRITQRALDETGIRLINPPVVLIVVRGMILAHSFPVAVTSVPTTINQDIKSDAADWRPRCFLLCVGVGWPRTCYSEYRSGRGSPRHAGHSHGSVRNFVIPIPPHHKQAAITAFLDRETTKIDVLVAKVREAIEHLNEFRAALISAAVTGKIDVRQKAPA